MYIKGSSSFYTKQQNQTDLLVIFLTDMRETKKHMILLMIFIHQLKEDIGEHIATRYVRDINVMTTRHDDDEKVFFPHHTSKQHYY